MSIRLSKKTSIIVAIILFFVVGGTGGYLLWRVNQEDTVAPEDSEAGVVCDRDSSGNVISCKAGGRDANNNCPESCAGYENGCCEYHIEPNTSCGDKSCNGSETLASCPQDCAVCGDGTCSSTESLTSCPGDCSVCGDNKCTGSEDATSCSADCACKAMTWTNKPTGTYTKSSTLPTITVVSTNSTEETGVSVKLNGTALPVCPSSPNCYALTASSSGTSSQSLSISLFSGLTKLEVGNYTLIATLPGASESCVESTEFVVSEDAVVDVPDTGLFDGTVGKISLGMGFVFIGVVTTQIPKFRYALNTLGEKNREVVEIKRRKKEERKRNRFERRFE